MRHQRLANLLALLAAYTGLAYCVASPPENKKAVGYGVPGENTPRLAFTADGAAVRYCTQLLGLGAIESKTGKVLAQDVLNGEYCATAVFSPTGQFWLTASGNIATVRDPVSGNTLQAVETLGGRVTSASVHGDGRRFVLVTEKQVEVYNTSDGSLVATLPSEATRAVLSEDGRRLALGDSTGGVAVRAVAGAETVRVKLLDRGPTGIAAVVLMPDDSHVVVGTQDGRVWLVHVPTGKVEELADVSASVTCLALNREGTLVAVGTVEPSFHIIDVTSRKQIFQIDNPPTEPGSVVFSPDSGHVVVGCWNGTCAAYRVRDNTRVWEVQTMQKAPQKR